jgi:lariat debranching enzyme
MNVAFVGCTHGELDAIYNAIQNIEKEQNITVDLLICCGDFEACRNQCDLDCLAGPAHYHYLKDFHHYYAGVKTAPKLTIFVGGNHEATNHLRELYYGGWVAPNIYFLGYSGVVNYGGLRIAGFSGIYKPYDYLKGHFEMPPYDESQKRSAFHVRKYELFKLFMVKNPIDIICSHDWPADVINHTSAAEREQLYHTKPYFKPQADKNDLGCKEYDRLMRHHWPKFWLAGHMHVKFEAVVKEEGGTGRQTHFMALDKVLPDRHFLEVIDVEPSAPIITGDQQNTYKLQYDEEWLAILRVAQQWFSNSPGPVAFPAVVDYSLIEKELQWVKSNVSNLDIPLNFTMTVTPSSGPSKLTGLLNSPQTEQFVTLLQLPTMPSYNGGSRHDNRNEYFPRDRDGYRDYDRDGGRDRQPKDSYLYRDRDRHRDESRNNSGGRANETAGGRGRGRGRGYGSRVQGAW